MDSDNVVPNAWPLEAGMPRQCWHPVDRAALALAIERARNPISPHYSLVTLVQSDHCQKASETTPRQLAKTAELQDGCRGTFDVVCVQVDDRRHLSLPTES